MNYFIFFPPPHRGDCLSWGERSDWTQPPIQHGSFLASCYKCRDVCVRPSKLGLFLRGPVARYGCIQTHRQVTIQRTPPPSPWPVASPQFVPTLCLRSSPSPLLRRCWSWQWWAVSSPARCELDPTARLRPWSHCLGKPSGDTQRMTGGWTNHSLLSKSTPL